MRIGLIAVLVFSGLQDLTLSLLAAFSPATIAPLFQVSLTDDARFLSALLGQLLAFFSLMLLYAAWSLHKRRPQGPAIAAAAGLLWIASGLTLYGFRGGWMFLIGDSLRGVLVALAALSVARSPTAASGS